jgi:hypothetical protein
VRVRPILDVIVVAGVCLAAPILGALIAVFVAVVSAR